jgi:hypothetical protein
MLFQGKERPKEPLRSLYYDQTSNIPFFEGFHTILFGPVKEGRLA